MTDSMSTAGLPVVLEHWLRREHDPALRRELQALRLVAVAIPESGHAALERATRLHRRVVQHVIASPRTAASRRELCWLLRSLASVARTLRARPDTDAEALLLRLERLDLCHILRTVLTPFVPLARFGALAIEWPEDGAVLADVDAARLRRVLFELCRRTLARVPPNGVVEARVEPDRATGEAVILLVGRGGRDGDTQGVMAADASEQARDELELHGGSLTYLSQPGRSGYRASVPLRGMPGWAVESESESRRAAVAVPGPYVPPVPPMAEGHRSRFADARPDVLLVDDSADWSDVATVLAATFSVVVSPGDTAVDRARELCPAVIVVGRTLPRDEQRRRVRAMRELPGAQSLVLAIIDGDDPGSAAPLLGEGAHDVVGSPVQPVELAARVRNAAQFQRARSLLATQVGEPTVDLADLAETVIHQQQELHEVLGELHEARRATERASRVKSNFLRMMSHELKTPVTALLLQKQLLVLDGLLDSPRGAAGLRSMSRSISRLLHIVDTMLEWARVESGRFRIERADVDLVDVTEAVVAECRHIAAGKSLEVVVSTPDGPCPARIDADVVKLILINVLERAIAVSASGPIEVEVGHTRDGARVVVRDRGKLIDDDEYRSLFSPLDPGRDMAGGGGAGSGLGLYVVGDLARAIGAEVCAAAGGAEGAVVELRLPG